MFFLLVVVIARVVGSILFACFVVVDVMTLEALFAKTLDEKCAHFRLEIVTIRARIAVFALAPAKLIAFARARSTSSVSLAVQFTLFGCIE